MEVSKRLGQRQFRPFSRGPEDQRTYGSMNYNGVTIEDSALSALVPRALEVGPRP